MYLMPQVIFWSGEMVQPVAEDDVEIFICMNVDCKTRGADATLASLKRELESCGMTHVKPEAIICFAACNLGPNVVIPSKRCWLSGVTAADAGVVVNFLNGAADIGRLQEKNDPVLDKMIFEMIDAGLLDKGES
jgi:(2Fe-2S) ferredoxin